MPRRRVITPAGMETAGECHRRTPMSNHRSRLIFFASRTRFSSRDERVTESQKAQWARRFARLGPIALLVFWWWYIRPETESRLTALTS